MNEQITTSKEKSELSDSPFNLSYQIITSLKKIDEEQRIIAGYASVEVIDKQNEVIPINVLKEAWERFWKNRDFAINMVMHSNIPVAKIIEEFTEKNGTVHKSGIDSTGLYIVSKIRDDISKGDETWDLIQREELKGYSIGGEAFGKTVVCEGDSCHQQIDKMDIHEISIVDNPANQSSLFNILKSVVSKPFAGFKDHADCVRRNKNKRDPHAFCAWLERRAKKYDELDGLLHTDGLREIIVDIIKDEKSKSQGDAVQSDDPSTASEIDRDSESHPSKKESQKIMVKVRLNND